MMPLDNYLNKDLHESVNKHVLMSKVCANRKEAPQNFSLAIPKKVAHAYE